MKSHVLLIAVLVGACGPTVGDPCTTPLECGPGTCLNQDFTPGGYCSLSCTQAKSTCPAGTVCVTGAIARDTPGCLRSCTTDKDCRLGYVCLAQKDSATPVCVGPRGL